MRGLDRVDTRLGKEVWVGDPLYGTTFQSAVTAIGSTPAILRIPAGTYSVSTNLTLPATLHIKAERDAIFAIATAITLTINGGLEAGPYQIFSCTGTGKVVFGQAMTIYPEWFGAVGDGSTNDLAKMQSALSSTYKGSTIQLGPKSYYCSGAAYWPDMDGITLKGAGRGVTKWIINSANDYGIMFNALTSPVTRNGITIKDMTFQGRDDLVNLPGKILRTYETTNGLTLDNVEFKYATYGGYSEASLTTPETYVNNLIINNCWFHDMATDATTYQASSSAVFLNKGTKKKITNNMFEDICYDLDSNLQHAVYHNYGDQVEYSGELFQRSKC